MTKGPIPHLRF